jgi:hypothetical protein
MNSSNFEAMYSTTSIALPRSSLDADSKSNFLRPPTYYKNREVISNALALISCLSVIVSLLEIMIPLINLKKKAGVA